MITFIRRHSSDTGPVTFVTDRTPCTWLLYWDTEMAGEYQIINTVPITQEEYFLQHSVRKIKDPENYEMVN